MTGGVFFEVAVDALDSSRLQRCVGLSDGDTYFSGIYLVADG